jgi:hypothetical protein
MSVTGIAGNTNTNVVATPTITNFSMPLANTEYSHTLPAGTRRFTLKNRTSGLIKLSYSMGQSGVEWYSIEPGTTYGEEDLRLGTLSFYFQSPTASQIVEILSWA